MYDGWTESLDNSSLTEKVLWLRSWDHPTKRSVSLSWLTKRQKGFPFLNRDHSQFEAFSQTDMARLDFSQICRTVLETKMTQTCVNSWGKHPSLRFVQVIKITQWGILWWVTPRAGLFFLAGRGGHSQAEWDLQPTHIKAALFLRLHFRPCLFLFWQETGDDNKVAQTSRGCLWPAAVPSSCGRQSLFSLKVFTSQQILTVLVEEHTKKHLTHKHTPVFPTTFPKPDPVFCTHAPSIEPKKPIKQTHKVTNTRQRPDR